MKLRECVYDYFLCNGFIFGVNMFMMYKKNFHKNLMCDTVFMSYVCKKPMNFFKGIQNVNDCERHLLTSSVKISAGYIEFFYKCLFSSHTFWKTIYQCKGLVEKVAKSSSSVQLQFWMKTHHDLNWRMSWHVLNQNFSLLIEVFSSSVCEYKYSEPNFFQ